MRLLDALKKLADPRGPIGELVSPSEVFKSRAGLPVSAPHSERARMAAPAHVEHALAAPRFVALADAVDVPRERVRQVSAFVEDVWAPVYGTTDSTDLGTILRVSQQQIGWRVTQRQSASSIVRKRLSAEDFREVVQSTQIQASDAFYNGVYETIPGNDPIVLHGEILRGEATYDRDGRMTHDGIVRGTMIQHGRAEYNARTKGWVHWDAGFVAQRKAALAEEASRPVRNVRRNLERVAGECLPMRRLVTNPRYDRKSAV